MRGLLPPTPLIPSDTLSDRLDRPVLLKLENLQATGSFKVRGAAARMLALSDDERVRGVVTCSSGNHGRAVAWVARRLGVPATVCVPTWVDPVKLDAIRADGARALVDGDSYDEAAARAEALARAEGRVLVHPFDDPWVAAGQGTIAAELLAQAPDLAHGGTVALPLSGGGLAGGVAAAFAARGARARVVAASAERAQVMLQSLRAGGPLERPEEDTVASALSGGIELANRWTFALVRDHVDAHVVVPEERIRAAMAWSVRQLRLVVEGGGAVALAAALDGLLETDRGPLVVVLSGGNVSARLLRQVLEGSPADDAVSAA